MTILACVYGIEIGIVVGNISLVVVAPSSNANWIIIQSSFTVSMVISVVVQFVVQLAIIRKYFPPIEKKYIGFHVLVIGIRYVDRHHTHVRGSRYEAYTANAART